MATTNDYKGKGALDAFLNLLLLITLGWLAWAIGAVFFQLINKYSGATAYGTVYFSESTIKVAIAALLVISPVFFGAVNVMHQKYKKDELNHDSGIYRWLTYLMLLVSALTIIGSLIALIAGFLNGDYTTNVVMKILTVVIIAGFIFGYNFFDLKRRDYSKINRIALALGTIVGVVIVLCIITGFMNVTSPQKTRLLMADSNAQMALSSISYMVSANYSTSGILDEMIDPSRYVSSGINVDLTKISYRKLSATEFELCADFNLDSADISPNKYNEMPTVDITYPWARHQKGHQCYTINAKTEAEKYNSKLNVPSGTAPAINQTEPPAPTGRPLN